MKSKLTRNLFIGFGFSLMVLLLSSIASYTSIQNLLASSGLVEHTYKVMRNLEEIMSTVKDAETGQRGYLLTGDPRFLEPYVRASEIINNSLDAAKKLTVDNIHQQQNIEKLRDLIDERFRNFAALLDLKKAGRVISIADFQKGKASMDSIRSLVTKMDDVEQSLLFARTQQLNRFSSYTPVLIVLASLLAITVAIVFFLKVRSDIEEKTSLQISLEKKDNEVSRRISIIQNMAEKIAAGNYSIRINDEEKDNLGTLALYLNKMTESLEQSFLLLNDKQWLQTGLAGLNEKMMGERTMAELAKSILDYLASYADYSVGCFYLLSDNKDLVLTAGYAFNSSNPIARIPLGMGLIGECARQGKIVILNDLSDSDLHIHYGSGSIKPKNIAIVPLHFEGGIKAVMQFGSLHKFAEREIELFENASASIGVAINTSQSRARLQELLEETQSQTEELQAQHSELENLNAEMEVQTEKLQTSEEELKVQQEELLETNRELEERSRLLEERNLIISERNLEIRRKADELEASTKYKSEFLANMSHELRTPLNSILLLSKLMAENNENNLSEEQVEYANVIQSSGNGLLELIDEILDLSKIEAGKMELDYSLVSVHELLQDMRKLFSPLASQKQLEFRILKEDPIPDVIETDKMRLEQIIRNLLSNAFKFTRKGSVVLRIAVPDPSRSEVELSVEDSGIGIPADKQKLVFEAFQQADGSTRRKYGGTGLGLSISRELTRLLGGVIGLTSEEGRGSRFFIRIPFSRKDVSTATELNIETPEIKEEFGLSEAVISVPAAQPRFISSDIPEEIPDDRVNLTTDDKIILIVEDDTAFARALMDFAHKKGYKAVVTVRGDAAIAMAIRYRPIGILLDIQLPVKSGWEVMEDLKNNSATRHIPVHIMSSFEVKKESLVKGAIDFINKPFAFEQMDDVFQKLEFVLKKEAKKVLIVEDNSMHAKALAYYLGTFSVQSEISHSVAGSILALGRNEVDCVILDMGVPDSMAYDVLDAVKKTRGLENIPIIIFTGKSLSRIEELRIKQYADSIVIKTAQSYQRILDEVSIFLHLVTEAGAAPKDKSLERLGGLDQVLKNKNVLVADDDVRNIFSLTKALEKYKMHVIAAMDGKEALRVLEENPLMDIILMDMMMPEMDGYETIRRIKSIPRFRNIPIIAVTAKAMTGDREKCIQAGASDYISKPVDVDQLMSLLRIWLYEKGF